MQGDVAPCWVEFTDTYQAPDERIEKIYTGEGGFLGWDAPGQTIIRHLYKKAGVYTVTAISINNVASLPKNVIVGLLTPEPDPFPSLWQRFISWLKRLFG